MNIDIEKLYKTLYEIISEIKRNETVIDYAEGVEYGILTAINEIKKAVQND